LELPYASRSKSSFCVSDFVRFNRQILAASRVFKYCVPAGQPDCSAYWGALSGVDLFLLGLTLPRIAFRGGFGYGSAVASTRRREALMTLMFEHRSRGPVQALWHQLQG
jgi:hypothetical protein